MHDDLMADDAPLLDVSDTEGVAPFIIEHRQEEASGTAFRPSAHLILTTRVRTSGLWRALSPEDIANLVLLFSFITPNGWCRPTLLELADAMGVSQPKAKTRFDRLTAVQWQGHPLATLLPRPDGLDAYLPGRMLVAHKNVPPSEPILAAAAPTPGRKVVVAYSRARYAKTREEVERQIGEMMGWAPPDFAGDDPAVAEGKRQAFKAMTDLGMTKEQSLDLLGRFDLGAVESQISWLPKRNAKNPARFLAAAIEGGYDAPVAVRQGRTTLKELTDEGADLSAFHKTPNE